MTASVYVNRARDRIVPEGSPEAAFRIHADEAERMGLLRKEQPKPADKMIPKPADKAARRPATK